MMRFILAVSLLLITVGTVDAASAETPEELTTLCQKGNAAACSNLGAMYANGTGVKQDSFKAVALYRKACDAQNAAACFNLGLMYDNGTGVRLSVEDALKFLGTVIKGTP